MDYFQIGLIVYACCLAFIWAPAMWCGIKALWWYIDDKDFDKFDSKYWTILGFNGDWMFDEGGGGVTGIPIVIPLSLGAGVLFLVWPVIVVSVGGYLLVRTARFFRRGQKAVGQLGKVAHSHKENGNVEKMKVGTPEF